MTQLWSNIAMYVDISSYIIVFFYRLGFVLYSVQHFSYSIVIFDNDSIFSKSLKVFSKIYKANLINSKIFINIGAQVRDEFITMIFKVTPFIAIADSSLLTICI